MEKFYVQLDISSLINKVFVNTELIETNLKNFFYILDKIPHINKRQEKTESNLNEYNELHYLMINYNFYKTSKFEFLNELPEPRVLVGVNTNKKFSEGSGFEALNKSIISV